jgi:hypothetical protein
MRKESIMLNHHAVEKMTVAFNELDREGYKEAAYEFMALNPNYSEIQEVNQMVMGDMDLSFFEDEERLTEVMNFCQELGLWYIETFQSHIEKYLDEINTIYGRNITIDDLKACLQHPSFDFPE